MNEFSIYEEQIIRSLIEYDSKRNLWERYIGIPTLDFISKISPNMSMYPSIIHNDQSDLIVFSFSIKEDEADREQAIILENQKKIIFILHLINKLMQNNYIACIYLDDITISAVLQSFTLHGVGAGLKKLKIAFDIPSLQKSFGDCLYKAIIVTDDLKRLVDNNFKSIEQIRHETELVQIQEQLNKADIQINKARITLNWTIRAFFVALIPALLMCVDIIPKWYHPKDATILELKNSVEQKKLPSIIKVEVTNNPLVVKTFVQTKISNKKKERLNKIDPK